MLKMSLNEIRGKIQVYPENWVNLSTTNCYAYALGLDIKESDICSSAYQPGNISESYNPNQFFYYKTLIKNLEEDFKTLDILYREIEPTDQINLGEWKIALLVDLYGNDIFNDLVADFHFLRQKTNGIWFHKNGFQGTPSKKDYLGNIITDPTKCCLDPYEYKKCYALRVNNRRIL